MGAKLVAEEGMLRGLVLSFDEGSEWVIGRDPDSCQLLLEDPSASRKHLLCKQTPEGITLENLSDTNPVEVNDKPLDAPQLLQDGDLVRIGSGVYRYFLTDNQQLNNPLEEAQKKAAQVKPEEEHHQDSVLEYDEEEASKHPYTEVHFPLPEASRWLLKVIGGPNNGAEFSMNPGTTYIIGTDPNSCDIVFHDTSVSRQHARISVQDNEAISVEDLKSRNGTMVDGTAISEKTETSPNTIVTMGTTSFVIYDREGNMQTIISPLMPSIVKVLQKDSAGTNTQPADEAALNEPQQPPAPPAEKSTTHLLFIAIVTGLFVLAAIGTTMLFKSEPVAVKTEINIDKSLADTFSVFPSLKYSFNKSNGRLITFGHLLTSQDKTHLLNSVQALPFIKSLDDTGVIIDEYVWIETNQVLNKNPNWRSITLKAPTAGQFILSGVLPTRKQADQLYEYMNSNFPHLDRLKKEVVVEEDVVNEVRSSLEKAGILNSQVSFKNGELTIGGGIPKGKGELYNQLLTEFKQILGVRNVKSLVSSLAESQSIVNVSDKYEVSGFSRIGKTVSVVINGRIVTKGDVLDGMTIQEISSGAIFLEKDGVRYRIDFSQ